MVFMKYINFDYARPNGILVCERRAPLGEVNANWIQENGE